MSQKSKGSNAERELVHLFWGSGWAAMRAAGSGSTQFPSPDILVGKNGRRLAIECKATIDTKKYFPEEEIRHLSYFADMFGAEVWLAIKFPRSPWYFFSPENLRLTGKSLVADLSEAELKGVLFDELIQQ